MTRMANQIEQEYQIRFVKMSLLQIQIYVTIHIYEKLSPNFIEDIQTSVTTD
jgi:hypothetical protein